MKTLKTLFILFCILLSFQVMAWPSTICIPKFPYRQGWMGADAAYSIAMNHHRVLWLFGDTFIQSHKSKISRQGAMMIHNSIALSTCDPKFSIRYYWQNLPHSPQAYFQTQSKRTYYWPKDGEYIKGKLYILLAKVKTIHSGVFGFEVVGSDLAIIDNPQDTPQNWRIHYRALTLPKGLDPGAAMIHWHQSLLIWTADNKQHTTILLRLNLKRLALSKLSWQTLGKNNQWFNGINTQQAKVFFNSNISEMSVFYSKPLQNWLAVYSLFPGMIHIKTAKSPLGPWHTFHAPINVNQHLPKGSFCYAAKAHAAFSQNNILITYVCNNENFNTLVNDLKLYRPKVLEINF